MCAWARVVSDANATTMALCQAACVTQGQAQAWSHLGRREQGRVVWFASGQQLFGLVFPHLRFEIPSFVEAARVLVDDAGLASFIFQPAPQQQEQHCTSADASVAAVLV